MCRSGNEGFEPIDYQEYTVTPTAAVSLDFSAYPPAATNLGMAFISVEDTAVRYSLHGTAPQADNGGHEADPGQSFYLCGRTSIEQFKMIRISQGATNGKVRVTIFKAK